MRTYRVQFEVTVDLDVSVGEAEEWVMHHVCQEGAVADNPLFTYNHAFEPEWVIVEEEE